MNAIRKLVAPITLAISLAGAIASAQVTPPVKNLSDRVAYIPISLPSISGGPSMTTIAYNATELPVSKLSPKKVDGKQLPFKWVAIGYGKITSGTMESIRLRVYTESQEDQHKFGIPAAREIMRIWELDKTWLGIDHNDAYNEGDVDVYLCNEGSPGGEQLFGTDTEGGVTHKVNTIYIYNLKTFTNPLEEAREVAHEYGHAVLPAIGGYKQPEYWANGYMGEELFLRWLTQEIKQGVLTSEDTMGASLPSLEKWVTAHTRNIEIQAAIKGPENPYLQDDTALGMDAYHGLMLYCDSIFPAHIYARALADTPGSHATDFVIGAKLAAEEATYSPNFPSYLIGKEVWLPVGSGKIKNANVLATKNGWAKVTAKTGILVVAGKIQN